MPVESRKVTGDCPVCPRVGLSLYRRGEVGLLLPDGTYSGWVWGHGPADQRCPGSWQAPAGVRACTYSTCHDTFCPLHGAYLRDAFTATQEAQADCTWATCTDEGCPTHSGTRMSSRR